MNQLVSRRRMLHVRRLEHFPAETDDWLSEQLTGANEVFSTANIEFMVRSDITTPSHGGFVRIEGCVMAGNATQEQQDLYRQVSNIPQQDIVVFLAHGFGPWQGGGCAWHPEGRLGCFVTVGKPRDTEQFPKWKLAHELGHVLGLQHVSSAMMLMYPSVYWTADPPRLSEEEAQAIRDNRPLPSPAPEEVLAISEDMIRYELSKIEPEYTPLVKFGDAAIPLLIQYCEQNGRDEEKARAIYALSLLAPSTRMGTTAVADTIVNATRSGPLGRRAATVAASAWGIAINNDH